jgi:hypothetical protein
MTTTAADVAPARPASMLTPVVDFLSVGGLSLLVFIPLLLSGRSDLVIVGAGVQAWLATLFNMPHFMASYRIVYRSREMILRHKWASIYIPLLLLAYALVAIWEARFGGVLLIVILAVAGAYLAWHYTGQIWGMMASYAYLGGSAFDQSERLLIRSSLRILLAWHVTWFFYTYLRNPAVVRPLYLVISAGTVVALGLGATGLAKFRRRTGKLPPARALIAWLSIFVWYAMLARDPKALFWVQIAHAVQYLAFPIRVEINRTAAHTPEPRVRRRELMRHMAAYAVLLLGASYLLEQVVPLTAMSIVADAFGEEPGRAAPILLLTFINIHHYFTDGVVWHISNPEVRKELFAHVVRPGKGDEGRGKGATTTTGKGKEKGMNRA